MTQTFPPTLADYMACVAGFPNRDELVAIWANSPILLGKFAGYALALNGDAEALRRVCASPNPDAAASFELQSLNGVDRVWSRT